MKKIIASTIVATAIIFSLTACGNATHYEKCVVTAVKGDSVIVVSLEDGNAFIYKGTGTVHNVVTIGFDTRGTTDRRDDVVVSVS